MLKVKYTFCLLLLLQNNLFAQIDSVKTSLVITPSFAKIIILPASLCIAGVIVKESNFREYFQKKVQGSAFRTNTQIDDYLQYTPIVELYLADYVYSKSKNEIFQHTKNMVISQLVSTIIVQTLKRTTKITRPDGYEHSFPSGHTALSFAGATGLYLEYREINPIIAYSGYGLSATTGLLRITNNRHWLSDVLVGAGIGILSSRIVWSINPFKDWKPFKSNKITVYPYVNGLAGNAGLYMTF